ncbi:hypothetical protein CHARACLAT_018840 [Characodon lateralis]|uniref:ATP synthase F0 subunit 8 n=1 Tax=Characodon lateralis TaxID=208331 RepID=A0ABU7DSA8_9TELE|nr:hypothetical protein [Characodon lateralis]
MVMLWPSLYKGTNQALPGQNFWFASVLLILISTNQNLNSKNAFMIQQKDSSHLCIKAHVSLISLIFIEMNTSSRCCWLTCLQVRKSGSLMNRKTRSEFQYLTS